MSNLSGFLQENAIQAANIKCIVSDRFLDADKKPIPWELRPLGEDEVEAIKKSCTKKEKLKTGGFQEVTDYAAVSGKLAAASVVSPNLKDADLQASYKVVGAEKLLRKMLTSGEYSNLILKTQEVSGYDKDINDLVEEAKN